MGSNPIISTVFVMDGGQDHAELRARELIPGLRYTRASTLSTVLGEMNAAFATCRLVIPSAASAATRVSVSVRSLDARGRSPIRASSALTRAAHNAAPASSNRRSDSRNAWSASRFSRRRRCTMETLWPGEEPPRVANRLSVALSTIRNVLDPGRRVPPNQCGPADSNSVAISLDAVEVDLERFLATAADGLRLVRRGETDRGLPILEAVEPAPFPCGRRGGLIATVG